MEIYVIIATAIAAVAAVIVSLLNLVAQWSWRKSDNVDERLKTVHQDIKGLDTKFDGKLDNLTTILLNKFQLPSNTA